MSSVPPPQQPKQTVDVIAPMNMAEGYEFNVDAGGKQLRVAVPMGGAVAGQRFAAIVLAEHTTTGAAHNNPHNIPVGRWRDELCDCCAHGGCHPQCCLACWCPSCAAAQIMTRLSLNWIAQPVSREQAMSTFKIVVIITAAYHVVARIFSIAQVGFLESVVGIAFLVYLTVITCQTRKMIRERSNIPVQCCGDAEDCCCSFWCNPCTVCQMGRHVTDFHNYSPECCTPNGLSEGAPDDIPNLASTQPPPAPTSNNYPPPPHGHQYPPPSSNVAPGKNEQMDNTHSSTQADTVEGGREIEKSYVVDI